MNSQGQICYTIILCLSLLIINTIYRHTHKFRKQKFRFFDVLNVFLMFKVTNFIKLKYSNSDLHVLENLFSMKSIV